MGRGCMDLQVSLVFEIFYDLIELMGVHLKSR